MTRQLLFTVAVIVCGCSWKTEPSQSGRSIESPSSNRPEVAPENPPPTKPATPRFYTRDDFNKAVLGLTADEVRKLLGPPDSISRGDGVRGNEGYWNYNKRIIDPETNKPDHHAEVWFTRGRCDQITFTP